LRRGDAPHPEKAPPRILVSSMVRAVYAAPFAAGADPAEADGARPEKAQPDPHA